MCDYSLHGFENRLAKEGEVLVVHRFSSGSKGLTSPEYLKAIEEGTGWMAILRKLFAAPRDCAVCIPVTVLNSRCTASRGLSRKGTASRQPKR